MRPVVALTALSALGCIVAFAAFRRVTDETGSPAATTVAAVVKNSARPLAAPSRGAQLQSAGLGPASCGTLDAWRRHCPPREGYFVLTRGDVDFCFSEGVVGELEAAAAAEHLLEHWQRKGTIFQYSVGRVGSKVLLAVIRESLRPKQVELKHSHSFGQRSNTSGGSILYNFGDPIDVVGSLTAVVRDNKAGWVKQHAQNMGLVSKRRGVDFPGLRSRDDKAAELRDAWPNVWLDDVFKQARHVGMHFKTPLSSDLLTVRFERVKEPRSVSMLAWWLGILPSRVRFPSIGDTLKVKGVPVQHSKVGRCERFKNWLTQEQQEAALATFEGLQCRMAHMPDMCFWPSRGTLRAL